MITPRTLLPAAVFLAVATTASAHPADAAINAVYAKLSTTRAAHDVAGMASSFHPQALLVDARPGPPVGGAELAGMLAPQRDRLVADGVAIQSAYRVERRQLVSDELAVDAGYMRQSLKREGAAETVRYARFLVTLKRGPAGWQIVADAAMPSTAQVWDALQPKDGLAFDR